MELKNLSKRALVPISSAIVGGLLVGAAFKLSPAVREKIDGHASRIQPNEQVYGDILSQQDRIRRQFDSIFNDEFIDQNNPFEEMRKMRNQMEKRMGSVQNSGSVKMSPLDSWFSDKFGGGTINEISEREDENFVYYDVTVGDVKSTSVKTDVENGYITISGTTEKKSGLEEKFDGLNSEGVFTSSFNRTFQLPENVQQDKMQMLTEKDKIVLKFPKLKA